MSDELCARTSAHARTIMTEYILPVHTNALGNVFGGQVLAWMDICAAICAQRHTGAVAVTAGIDDLAFELPIKVGQVARIEASVSAAFRTSVEIEVRVLGENSLSGATWPCVHAFLTFVAIDGSGRPQPVPPLLALTERERALASDAGERRSRRLARRGG